MTTTTAVLIGGLGILAVLALGLVATFATLDLAGAVRGRGIALAGYGTVALIDVVATLVLFR
jgi:hypothetical protein